MRDVAREIPLTALTLAGCGQGRHAAHPGIQALGDAFDRTALAGSISSFKDHHDFELLVDDPVLQFDQLALEAKKLLEVALALELIALTQIGKTHLFVIKLNLELLIKGVERV